VRSRPRDPAAWAALGRALVADGSLAEGADALGRAGRLSAEGGDLAAAERLFAEAVAAAPGRWEARHDLGRVKLSTGRHDAALAAFEAAAAADARAIPPRLVLGRLLERAGRPADAAARYGEILAAAPGHPDALAELGFLNKLAGRHAQAEAHFRAALAADPRHGVGSTGLAGLLELRGAYAEALEALAPALGSGKATPALELVAARIERRAYGAETAYPRLARLAAVRLADSRIRGRILFQLAQTCDEMGRYEEAFRAAAQANELRREAWDARAHAARVSAIAAAWPAGAGESSGEASPTPVFVVGMPRSGTTLVEHLLARHPAILPAGERNDVLRLAARLPDHPAPPDSGTLAAAAREYLAATPDAPRVVDKMPVNFLHLGLVGRLFPNARVIHCEREPLDSGLSCWLHEFSGPEFGFSWDLADIGRYWRDYRRLMDHWLEAGAAPVLSVRYESLVDDPDTALATLVAHLGLDPAELRDDPGERDRRIIATSSHAQVRRPVTTGSVGRHRHYARWIEPLAVALQGPP